MRILAATQTLLDGLNTQYAAFSTLSAITNSDALDQIDRDFAEWMARYACVDVDHNSIRSGPQLDQIRTIIVHLLSQKTILDDQSLEALTLLAVFMARPIHANLMPYTRKILGSALPPRTPEMEEAVNTSTAGLHIYEWGTNGLGEEGQAQGWGLLFRTLGKGIQKIGKLLDIITQIEKNVSWIALDGAIFIMDIVKISPSDDPDGNPYRGWAEGEKQFYLGFQAGLTLSPPTPKGIYLEANSTQLMYSSVNWDPEDFSGGFQAYSLSAGLVIDPWVPALFRIDINSMLEDWLRDTTFVEWFAGIVGYDPDNIKLGTGLSATLFIGNNFDGQVRVPILSRGMNWIDYSYELAYILEASAMYGFIIHIPEWISGVFQAEKVADQVLSPIDRIEWRVIESRVSYQSFNDIDEWQLENHAKIALRQMVAEYLACFRNRNTKLSINGHASPIGPEAYNLWLSQKRAQAVYDYIRSILSDEEYAILPHNTSIVGFGELYADLLGAAETDPEWQTVTVFLNGQLVAQIGERISG